MTSSKITETEFRTTDCFKDLRINDVNENNPDIEFKMKEHKQTLKNFIKSNFKTWDGYKYKEPNIYEGRRPSPLQRIMNGMKSYFFGERGKVTKKSKILKNLYQEAYNKKSLRLKQLSSAVIMTNNKTNFMPELEKFKIQDLIKEIPKEEREDFIKKSGIKLKRTLINKLDSKSLENFDNNFNRKNSQLSELSKINGITSTMSTIEENSKLPHFKSNSISIIHSKSRNDQFHLRHYSTLNQGSLIMASGIQEKEKFEIKNDLPKLSYLGSFESLKLKIDKKFDLVNKKGKKINNQISKFSNKLNHPLKNKMPVNKDIDKEVIKVLNQKFKEKKSHGIIGADPEILKIMSFLNSTKQARNDMIKISDEVSKMNDVMAAHLANKIISTYNKKAVNAEIDEKSEFKKKYNFEDILKPIGTNIVKNGLKIKKIKYNINHTKNQINSILERKLQL
jgi:hypothetical protein